MINAPVHVTVPAKQGKQTRDEFLDAEEQGEKVKHLPGADAMDRIFGTTVKRVNYTFPDQKITGNTRLTVQRFYMTENACWDVVPTKEIQAKNKRLLNLMGIAYVSILAGGCKCLNQKEPCQCGGGLHLEDAQRELSNQKYAMKHPAELPPTVEELAELAEAKRLADEKAIKLKAQTLKQISKKARKKNLGKAPRLSRKLKREGKK